MRSDSEIVETRLLASFDMLSGKLNIAGETASTLGKIRLTCHRSQSQTPPVPMRHAKRPHRRLLLVKSQEVRKTAREAIFRPERRHKYVRIDNRLDHAFCLTALCCEDFRLRRTEAIKSFISSIDGSSASDASTFARIDSTADCAAL